MAKSRKKELPLSDDAHPDSESLLPGATDFNPSEFEQPAPRQNEFAEQQDRGEKASTNEQAAEPYPTASSAGRRETDGHAAAARKRRSSLPDKLSLAAGDVRVMFVDKGDNRAGIGIRVAFPEGERNRPSAEEKEIIRTIVKGEEGQRSSFNWNQQVGMWHKDILRPGEHPDDVPPMRAVAIRLDAERRVEKLADALARHQADPASYAERVRLEREQAARDRFPD